MDDVGALAMLHALADLGEVDLLGVMVTARNNWSALCADRINTYFNRPELPLGQLKGDGVFRVSAYAQTVAEEFDGTIESADDLPSAVDEYRRILASRPDNSVVILTIGYLTNLRNLLQSEGASCIYSDLDGSALVEKKVRKWVCMGGKFPDGGVESNIGRFDPEAAEYVIENWPTETHFVDWNIGNIDTGHNILDLPESNPVRRAYELFGRIPHKSWDQVATLYAVRVMDDGPADYWSLSDIGYVEIIPEDNYTDWHYGSSPHATGDQYYLIQQGDTDEIAAEINKLMMHVPADAPSQYLVSVDRVLPAAGSDVVVTAQLSDENESKVYDPGRTVHWTATNGGSFSSTQTSTDEQGRATVTFTVSSRENVEHEITAIDDADNAITGGSPIITTREKGATGLIAYYPFNEGTGDIAADQSGFGDPLDLKLSDGAQWLSEGDGVMFDGSAAKLQSAAPAGKLYERIVGAGEFSVEFRGRPFQSDQGGPARIVSFSGSTGSRNFTLGHGDHQSSSSDLVFRLRTTDSDANGMPDFPAADAIVDQEAHYVVSYDGTSVRFYRDGALIHTGENDGEMSNWDNSFPLILGNEKDGSRGWAGELYSVAIFNTALSSEEVGQRYEDDVGGFVDTVGNGICDDWEIEHFGYLGVDPDADPDQDGMTNREEFLAGTDPNDADSRLEIVSMKVNADKSIEITWNSDQTGTTPTRHYRVLFTEAELSEQDSQSWRVLADGLPPEGERTTFTYSPEDQSSGRKIFRIDIDPSSLP